MQEKTNKNKIIFSIAVSICSISALIFTSQSNLKELNTCCLWGLGCIYLALGWYFLFWKYDAVRYRRIGKMTRRCMILLCSLLITGVLFSVLPFKQGEVIKSNFYEKELMKHKTMTIRTLGDKNPNSGGWQVWLEGIRSDGRDYNLYEIPLPEGWEFRDDRPYTEQQAVSELNIPLSAKWDYTVMIRRGPDAGMVEAAIGERTAIFDLYAEEEEQRAELDLKKIILKEFQPEAFFYERLLYNFAYILILWLAAFTFSICLLSFLIKEKYLKDSEEHHDRKNDRKNP